MHFTQKKNTQSDRTSKTANNSWLAELLVVNKELDEDIHNDVDCLADIRTLLHENFYASSSFKKKLKLR